MLVRSVSYVSAMVLALGVVLISKPAFAAAPPEPVQIAAFTLEIPGMATSDFRECSAFGSETEVLEAQPGGEQFPITAPGRTKFLRLVCNRRLDRNLDLWNWRQEVIEGNFQRKDISIVIFDTTVAEVARFNFFDAWPSKLSVPTLNAADLSNVVEELTIVYDYMERVVN